MMDDLISRQAAIDAIVNTPSEVQNKNIPLVNQYDGATFRQIEILGIIEALPSAQPEQRWIPCSERTPEDKKAVYWVCNDSGDQFECRWTNVSPLSGRETDWHWNIFDVPQYSKVVAWMPLPEPYKEKTDDPEG